MKQHGLEIHNVCVSRGSLPVCRSVSLEVNPGEVVALLGPNGAGKSTLLDSVAGTIEHTDGTVILDGTDLSKKSRMRRARSGLSYVEQGRSVLGTLTVEENLLVTATSAALPDLYARFPRLHERRTSKANLLSGGEQQMLVIARAIASQPSVLIVDELSLGLAPTIVHGLLTHVRELADQGMAVLLVEQFAALALSVADRAYVMERGQIVFGGTAQHLIENPDLIARAYLAIPTDMEQQ